MSLPLSSSSSRQGHSTLQQGQTAGVSATSFTSQQGVHKVATIKEDVRTQSHVTDKLHLQHDVTVPVETMVTGAEGHPRSSKQGGISARSRSGLAERAGFSSEDSDTVGGAVPLVTNPIPLESIMKAQGEGLTRAKSGGKVTFTSEVPDKPKTRIYRKEVALDRLWAFDNFKEKGIPKWSPPMVGTVGETAPAWWLPEEPNEALWAIQLGEVYAVKGRQLTSKSEIEHALTTEADTLLPPPLGAGYVSHPELNPLAECQSPVRAIFKVDSGCEPHTIVSRSLVQRAGLKPFKSRTMLKLADSNTCVTSEEMVRMRLRVTIGDRPRIFTMVCVVWERGALDYDILISQTVAVTTGLSIFVHDNCLREVILGKQALLAEARGDPEVLPQGSVAALNSVEEDAELFSRISPIDGIREALAPATLTSDDWVNEELQGPLKDVFGPLPKEPADVPPMEFTVVEELVKQRVYAKGKPTKLPSSSPRNFDVMSAQFKELKDAGIMGDSYPDYPPGPIASIAFTVPKPGVKRLPRPEHYGNSEHPLSVELRRVHEEYLKSLTAERLVCNFQPVNEVSVVQNYPLPSVQSNLAKLAKFKYWAKIDLTKAFWSIPLHPSCRKWTYTIAPGGLSGVWLRAPMGLAPVPGYFMWTLSGVLEKQLAFTLLYADDILVGGNSVEELRANIRKVLARLLEKGFRVSASKCQFKPAEEIQYLGWTVREGKIFASPTTLNKLFTLRKPDQMSTCKDDKARIQAVRRFLGVLQYFAHYIPCNAEQLRPLYDLTRTSPEHFQDGSSEKKNGSERGNDTAKKEKQPRARFRWTPEADAAWDWAAQQLQGIKPLTTPTYGQNTWLEVISDASKWGWGGILLEWTEGDPRPRLVYCVSGTFSGSQLNWPTCTKEMYGVWTTVCKLRHFIHLHNFVLSMDHRNLLWGSMSTNEMVARMAVDLQQYRFVMRHIEGTSNVLCDYLSRAEYSSPADLERLRQRKSVPHPSLISSELQQSPAPAAVATIAEQKADAGFDECLVHSVKNLVLVPGSESDDSNITVRRFFDLGDSTDAGALTTDAATTDEESASDQEGLTIQGFVAPMGPAEQMEGPHPEDAPVHPMLQVRVGEPRARQRRRHRIRRQPEPSPDRPALNDDDGLAIPHMLPQPAPPPRQLSAQQYNILKSFHGGVLPHTGVAPLLQALAENGHRWDGIEEDAAAFVTRCHYCQMERLVRRGPQSLPYRSVQIPSTLCELWHFDILGPLPPCALTGARFILVAIEDTSKLVMMSRAVECSVAEIVLFLLDCFKIFGLPITIKTDKGGQYLSKAVQEFMEATGIKHEIGIAHYHQSDAVVENGAALIWPYLRIMCAELQKFHAWSPLLCNVQLGANALNRAVLGGASASEIMFNRKVRPLRFLRPERQVAPEAARQVSNFISEQAQMQLRLLGRADAERHRRFRVNQEDADEDRDGLEHLDWVREGMLVSIPQPDNEQHFNRPYKLAFLRRGPYEVGEVRPRSVRLRDYRKAQEGQPAPWFLWPKYNLAQYHLQSGILPPVEPVVDMENAEHIDPLPIAQPPALPAAILSHRPLQEPVRPNEARHVRNQEYYVRWANRSHASNSFAPYDAVWASPAFDEFFRGSDLTGHVHVARFQGHHLNQMQALMRGGRPRDDVPMDQPQVQVEALRNFFPLAANQRPNSRAAAQAAMIPPLGLSQDLGQPEPSPQPPFVSQDQEEPHSQSQEGRAPPVQQLRRSDRHRQPRSFGSDFVSS